MLERGSSASLLSFATQLTVFSKCSNVVWLDQARSALQFPYSRESTLTPLTLTCSTAKESYATCILAQAECEAARGLLGRNDRAWRCLLVCRGVVDDEVPLIRLSAKSTELAGSLHPDDAPESDNYCSSHSRKGQSRTRGFVPLRRKPPQYWQADPRSASQANDLCRPRCKNSNFAIVGVLLHAARCPASSMNRACGICPGQAGRDPLPPKFWHRC